VKSALTLTLELKCGVRLAFRSIRPVFFANDPARYLSLIQDQNSDSFLRRLLIPFALGLKGTLIALKTNSSKISNPLQTRYWSMVPYQLGIGADRDAVKFSARSCAATRDPNVAIAFR
jgi:hypothetical protein